MTDSHSHLAPESGKPQASRAWKLVKALLLAAAYTGGVLIVLLVMVQVGGFLWNSLCSFGRIVIFEGGPLTLLLAWAIYRDSTREPIKFCDLCGEPTRYSNPSPLAAKVAADIVCCKCHHENGEEA